MGNRKRSGSDISPWLSARQDSREKRFIQAGNSLLLSKTFQSLSYGARYLYLCMTMESGGHRAFLFPLSTARKYGITSSSLRRHVTELEQGRFIRVWSGQCVREPNRYEFSFGWKDVAPFPTPMAISSKSGPIWHKEGAVGPLTGYASLAQCSPADTGHISQSGT